MKDFWMRLATLLHIRRNGAHVEAIAQAKADERALRRLENEVRSKQVAGGQR